MVRLLNYFIKHMVDFMVHLFILIQPLFFFQNMDLFYILSMTLLMDATEVASEMIKSLVFIVSIRQRL